MNLNELSVDQSLVDEDIGTYALMDTTLIHLGYDSGDERAAAQLAAEYNRFSDKVAQAIECVHVARDMRKALSPVNPRAGIKPVEARTIAVALEGLKTSITGQRSKKLSYGLESLNSEISDSQALKLAREGIGSFIKDVIRSIIDAIIAIGQWIGEFISRLFNRESQSGQRIESIEKSIKDTEKKSENLDPRAKDIVKRNVDEVAQKNEIAPSDIPANPKARDELAKNVARDLTQLAKGRSEAVKPEDVQAQLNKHATKIFKPSADISAVPDLHIDGKYYSSYQELVKWMSEMQKEHVEKYLRATNQSNIQQAVDLVTKIINQTESTVERTDATIDLVNVMFKPMEHELMGAKVVNGVKEATGTVTIGDYATVATAPDTNSGGHLVERHLGASHMAVKKVGESVLQVPKQGLPRIELDEGKKIIDALKHLRTQITAVHLRSLDKAQKDLLAEAKKLETRHQGDEELEHVSHFGITAVNAFNSTFVSYISSAQVYIGKIINQVTTVAAVAAGHERAVLLVAEDLISAIDVGEEIVI